MDKNFSGGFLGVKFSLTNPQTKWQKVEMKRNAGLQTIGYSLIRLSINVASKFILGTEIHEILHPPTVL